jgi:hypothetical protein
MSKRFSNHIASFSRVKLQPTVINIVQVQGRFKTVQVYKENIHEFQK